MPNLPTRDRLRLSLTGAAGVIVVLALLAAAARAPGVVRLAYDSAAAPGQSQTQRELAPFRGATRQPSATRSG